MDRLADDIQSRIDEEDAKVFSRKTLEEARHPANYGPMENPDGQAIKTGSCGDTMQVFIKVMGDRITEASFVTDGCGATIACGSMLTKMVIDRPVDEVMTIRDTDLIGRLDGLPEENHHCARLAVGTLHGAVNVTPPYRALHAVEREIDE